MTTKSIASFLPKWKTRDDETACAEVLGRIIIYMILAKAPAGGVFSRDGIQEMDNDGLTQSSTGLGLQN